MNNDSYIKRSFAFLFGRIGPISAAIFVLLLLALSSSLTGYVGLLMSLLAVCLLVVPFLFGLLDFIIETHQGKNPDIRTTTSFSIKYFSYVYRGSFLALRNFLKAILLGLAISMTVSMFYYPIASSVSAEFREEVEQLISISEVGDAASLNAFISDSVHIALFIDVINVSFFFGGMGGFFFFVFLAARHASIKIISPMDTRLSREVYRRLKRYADAGWGRAFSLNVIVLVMAFLSGIAVCIAVRGSLDNNINLAMVIGLAVSLFIVSIFSPVFLTSSSLFVLDHPLCLQKAKVDTLRYFLDVFERGGQLGTAGVEALKRQIEAEERKLGEIEENQK